MKRNLAKATETTIDDVNAHASMTLKQLQPFEILATNKIGWGVGKTMAQATDQCKKNTRLKPAKFFLIPENSEIDGLSITYPLGAKFLATEL